MSNSIYETLYKFQKLYNIILKDKEESELLTPNYFKQFEALIHLSSIFYNQILRINWMNNSQDEYKTLETLKYYTETTYIKEDELEKYTQEILKFYNDSIDIYMSLEYNGDVHKIILNI